MGQNLFARCDQLGAELFFAHAGLLGTDVLHVQPKNAGKLGQVIRLSLILI